MKKTNKILVCLMLGVGILLASIPLSDRVWIRIGSLQSHFDAWGAERAWNTEKGIYEGLQWPAGYDRSDNFVIDRQFMACRNFIDQNGDTLDYSSVKFHTSATTELFSQSLSQTAKYQPTTILVSGITQTDEESVVDNVDPLIKPDRIITNVVRTDMGVTMTRNILAFSQQYNDNYFIYEYTFENTGNIDDDDTIEVNGDIHDFYFGMMSRYSTCREAYYVNNMRQASWGAHQWLHHTPMIDNPDLPYFYTWLGQARTPDITLSYDNIGIPVLPDEAGLNEARLRCPQFAGMAVLHCDTEYNNTDNCKSKIRLGWYIGDEVPPTGNDAAAWQCLNDNYNALGTFDIAQDDYANHEIADRLAPYLIIRDKSAAGTNSYMSFGPYEIPFGESIRIVICEAVAGLSRDKAIDVGKKWYQAYSGTEVEYDMPPAPRYRDPEPVDESADSMDIYKDMWVYTGKDSIIKTFYKALDNFENDYQLTLPPPPPSRFEIIPHTDKIQIEWSDEPDTDPVFEGYRLYRSTAMLDSSFDLIFECSLDEDNVAHIFEDTSLIEDIDYYYYLSSYTIDDTLDILESSRFYTQTRIPVSLGDISAIPPENILQEYSLSQNYPNPFNPVTTISYTIPESGAVRLSIYDISGSLIQTVVNKELASGIYDINFDASAYPSGLYIYRLEANGHILSKKMLLMK